jgi:molybdenum cofactor synthesis domain-containing protein
MVAVKEVKRQKPYTVELVCVGNELLIGKTLNTNGRWVADRIVKLGGKVSRETTVRDDVDEISSSIQEALRRKPDLIITSGGLGPTHDDMTLRGVAMAVGRPVQLSPAAVRLMKAHYRRLAPTMKIRWTKPRLKMAHLPRGSDPIENPVGSAPAVSTKHGRTTIFSLPGVPKELKAIFNWSLAPLIRTKAGNTSFFQESIMIRGIVESELSPIIDRVMKRYPNVFVKSHPRRGKRLRDSQLELHFSSLSSNWTKTRQEILDAITMVTKSLASRRPRDSGRRKTVFRHLKKSSRLH